MTNREAIEKAFDVLADAAFEGELSLEDAENIEKIAVMGGRKLLAGALPGRKAAIGGAAAAGVAGGLNHRRKKRNQFAKSLFDDVQQNSED